MHDAYSFSPCTSILNSIDIESIATLGNKLIIGTKTGKLFMYSILRNADSTNYLNMNTFSNTRDKKPIRQMKCVPEKNLLFALTNGMINVFYVGGFHFALTHRCVETKGCQIFAVDVKVAKSKAGETACTISLCVSIKRVLKFFICKSEELELLDKQIALDNDPEALQFMDGVICVGFRDKYVAYNIFSETPERNELIATPLSSTKRPCICFINNSIFGLTRDDSLVFIDSNTLTGLQKFEREQKIEPINWGGSVLDFVWDEPYLIGRTDNGLEIHVLKEFASSAKTLIQTIPDLNDVKFLVTFERGDLFVASQTKVWYLRMADVVSQRKVLLMQKEFKLAIELTALSSEPEKFKTEAERKIRILYGRDLFEKKDFAQALQQFFKADVNPSDVIALFPNSVKGELKDVKSSIRPLNMPELEDKDLEIAIPELIKYLTDIRPKEIYFKSKRVSLVDTTLLRCYLQTNNALIAPLLRRKQCNFLESESILKKHNKLDELIILYKAFNEHEKALTLLKSQASGEGSSDHERVVEYLQNLDNDHKDLVFEYSKWVLDNHPEDGLRIFTNTLSLCEHENNPIPTKEVLDFLSKASEISVLPYLEHVVFVLNDSSQFFYEVLVKTYVQQIQNLSEKRKLRRKCDLPKKELTELQSHRSKLFGILKKSDNYRPERILKMLPVEDFSDERIQVLERMNNHEKILEIYIQILGNVEKALEYCEKVQDCEVFEMLLQILLNPLTVSPYEGVRLHKDFLEPNLELVLQILNKYPEKFDLPKVFSILPDNIPVHRIKIYMEIVSRINMTRSWHFSILRGILTAELLRLNQETLLHRQKNAISLTELSTCKKCEKYFANDQVLVRSVNGDIEHYACFKNKNS